MSINPYYHYMLSLSGQKEKESFFQKAWGKLNLLSREASRVSSREFRSANVEMRALHHEQILSSFNCGAIQSEHADHINGIASDMLSVLENERKEQTRKKRELAAFNRSVQVVIERVIENLNPYAGLLNKAVGHTELRTVITGPETVVEEIRRPGIEDVEYRKDFRARLSTSTWSLLLRGSDNRIDVFIIPVDKVLRLTKIESFYRPVAQLNAQLDDGTVKWELDGQLLCESRLHGFFIGLYHELLDRTREQMLRQRGIPERQNAALEYTYAAQCAIDMPRLIENFDYRANQPELFGPGDFENQSMEPEHSPGYACNVDETSAVPADYSIYLLSESDFATERISSNTESRKARQPKKAVPRKKSAQVPAANIASPEGAKPKKSRRARSRS